MKERPILFSGEMVHAILDGRKTQTRRVVKPQPEPTPADYSGPPGHWWACKAVQQMVHVEEELQNERGWAGFAGSVCPYGQPGDRLWVREAFRLFDSSTECSCYDDCCCSRHHGKPLYRADDDGESTWKPSIHMPRWASRITLEIVSVRVERLQDISEADAKAEGTFGPEPAVVGGEDCEIGFPSHVQEFRHLWQSINGAGSWETNPWVWVVEFRRVEP